MRYLSSSVVLALVVTASAAAQDRARERRSLGADSLFGPGIVDLSANGSAVKLRLTRPAHVVVVALGEAAGAQLVLPRRSETRASRTGDQWIDLPGPAMPGGEGRVTFQVARVDVAARRPARATAELAGGTRPVAVALVIVSDSGWNREAVAALLPPQLSVSPMATAHAIATALIGGRADTCAAYLVRW